jgi:hypothetical protein
MAQHRHRSSKQHLFFTSSSDYDSKWNLPTLEVAYSAMSFLDLIILGWAVTMHDITSSAACPEIY